MEQLRETDEELMLHTKENDQHAFAVLMDSYIDRMNYFVRRYVRTGEAADDIVQDTFFKLWKYRRRYSRGKNFKPWLYSIARNTALDHIKKKKDASFSSLDTDDSSFADNLVDTADSAPDIISKRESAEELNRLLDTLHPEYRNVVVMHDLEDMTFADIGIALDKPLNTVKSWYRRAMQQLKKI